MPRRNLMLLASVVVVSLACYHKVQTNRYGRVLVDAMDQIDRYALEPASQEDLFEAAMYGMVSQLDKFSGFVSARDKSEFDADLDQKFGGLGIAVFSDDSSGQLTVSFPIPGSPADEAGLRAGDRILRIDDRSTQGLSIDEAVDLMQGDPGTAVSLSVLHEGAENPADIEVVRAEIQRGTVLGDRRNADGTWEYFLEGADGIGYVRISSFTLTTGDELAKVLARVRPRLKGLVLDLRDDPGGYLDAAVGVCDLLIDSGEIVTTRHRDRSIRSRWEATADGTYGGFPVAVLINGESASASEIVAACLQDHGRAVVVGERSYGKGTVQEVIPLEGDLGALRLTIASYWRPSGRNIHRGRDADEDADWGVVPDEGCKVILGPDEEKDLRLWRVERDGYHVPVAQRPQEFVDGAPLDVDRQLAKAVEVVERAIGEPPIRH